MAKRKILRKISNRLVSNNLPIEDTPIDMVELSEVRRETKLEEILRNKSLCKSIEDSALIGCSIGTIASRIGVPYDHLKNWLYRGREECARYDESFEKTPHMKLWIMYRTNMSEARTLAETTLAQRNPEAFLKSKAVTLLGDDWTDSQLTQEQKEEQTKLDVGASILETFRIMRRQGIDLNDIVDNNMISIKSTPPEQSKDDVIDVTPLLNHNPSLPDSLQKNL